MSFNLAWIQTAQQLLKKQVVQIALLVSLIILAYLQLTGMIANGFESFVNSLFPPTPPITEVRNLIVGGLNSMDELVTVKMSSKATVVVSQDHNISRLKIGDTNVVYEGVGTIQAGVNLKEMVVKSLDSKRHKITVMLPPPHITQTSLDINDSHTVLKYRQWFGERVEAELQAKAQKDALRLIKKEACSNHILETANSNAESLITNILSKADYNNIEVKTKTPQKNACALNN